MSRVHHPVTPPPAKPARRYLVTVVVRCVEEDDVTDEVFESGIVSFTTEEAATEFASNVAEGASHSPFEEFGEVSRY